MLLLGSHGAARRQLQYSSKRILLPVPLCRPLRRHARTAAAIGLIESVLRAYCEHSLGSTVEFTASPCRELRMDESVMVSSVSGQRTGCVGLLLRDRHARPFSVCLSSHALLAGQAGPRRFYASVQPNQRQRPGRHVGSIRGRSAAAGCMGDG